MDFERSYLLTNETLGSCPFLSSKLYSVIKTLERHFFTLSECLSNVLITGESNLDERIGQSFVRKEVISYKIGILVIWGLCKLEISSETKPPLVNDTKKFTSDIE